MLVIKNATIFEEGEARIVDVGIDGGYIVQIAKVLESDQILDASGLYLLPGIIDLNVRFKDDTLSAEYIKRVQKKAKRSGVTTFAMMPDFTPYVESDTFMQLLKEKLDSGMLLALKGLKATGSDKLNNISTLLGSGAKMIQENSHINGNLLRRILQYALMKRVPFFCFCDNPDLNDNGVMHEGVTSSKLGLAGISKVSEISEVAKVAAMAEYYGAKTHFQSISTAKSLDIIARAKHNNADISAEVSIHHLILNDEACADFNTFAKVYPPLRDEGTRKKMIAALQNGKIDTLTSLHASKSFNSKDVPFNDAAYGVDALEEFLALCYTYLVKEDIIEMHSLIKLLSENPAKILGEEKLGKIKEGYVADLLLFDPNSVIYHDSHIRGLYKKELVGEVKYSIKRGVIL
jgi:dihydroorotase